ncbi:MAG: radical SAM protein, partial [Candidatus Yanofskybacteria bacterium]|nr:radical SAM protein [Candidatus Yanofskybacteria bacterium]
MKLVRHKDWPLVRFIIPAFPEVNIFTRVSDKMTPLGPILIATAASKVWGWRVEVVDENNYTGPRDPAGMPDHTQLQEENFASVVGFYFGLTSTVDRGFELAKYYHDLGVITIAGAWHAHYCSEEVLNNGINVVFHGDGEIAIQQFLATILDGGEIFNMAGISFSENGEVRSNPPAMLQLSDLDDLPYPDYGLLRYARKIKTYSIGRVRGCAMNCEFCSVKGRPRWASPEHLFRTVNWLVETRKAKMFFIVDDRLEENIEGTMEFFRLVAAKYGSKLSFTVQVRLESAKNTHFLEIMRSAGVQIIAVGIESPIPEDLSSMRKGYKIQREGSADDKVAQMLEWAKTLRRYFWVHGMFIFGYPKKEKYSHRLAVSDAVRQFKAFIKRADLSSIQVLHPVPIVGTELRERLEKEQRILPRSIAPWSKYDGNYLCFIPDDMTVKEAQ